MISQSPLRLAYADKDGCEVVGCAKEQVDDLVKTLHKSSVLRGSTKMDSAGSRSKLTHIHMTLYEDLGKAENLACGFRSLKSNGSGGKYSVSKLLYVTNAKQG